MTNPRRAAQPVTQLSEHLDLTKASEYPGLLAIHLAVALAMMLATFSLIGLTTDPSFDRSDCRHRLPRSRRPAVPTPPLGPRRGTRRASHSRRRHRRDDGRHQCIGGWFLRLIPG